MHEYTAGAYLWSHIAYSKTVPDVCAITNPKKKYELSLSVSPK